MPLPHEYHYNAKDYWELPEDKRAELIDGKLYFMAPPGFTHQKLVSQLSRLLGNHIAANHGNCEVIPAPFAVNLNADDTTYVEPDLSIICDKHKLTEKGCTGAPDFIIEIVSPSSRKMDYNIKNGKYSEAGVREYWIVDPAKKRTTIYHYEEDAAPVIYPFEFPIESGVFPGFIITISELLN